MGQPSLDSIGYLEWTEPDTGELVRLYSDVVKDEAPVLPAVVTQHPVEKGSKITDHYRKDPKTFRESMYFSGSPIRGDLDKDNPGAKRTFQLPKGKYPDGPPLYTPGGLTKAASGAIGSLVDLITGASGPPTSFQALAFATDPRSRFEKIVALIERFQTEGILLTVKFSFGSWDNMAILNAAPHRSADTGDGLELELDFQEVRFVTSDVTFGAPLPVEPRGIPKKSGVSAGAGSEVPEGPKKTALRGLVGKL